MIRTVANTYLILGDPGKVTEAVDITNKNEQLWSGPDEIGARTFQQTASKTKLVPRNAVISIITQIFMWYIPRLYL